jgi:hypothetical protein
MPEEWVRQYLLTLIGSALRTVADPELDLADRWWFFEVAALATRAYGEQETAEGASASHPATPPSTVRRSEPAAPFGSPPGETEPVSAGEPERFPGTTKRLFVQRLGDEWRDLADLLGIPPYVQRRFLQGDQGCGIWEWLEVRERLGDLHSALLVINRDDLAALLLD